MIWVMARLSRESHAGIWERANPWSQPHPLTEETTLPVILSAVLAETLLYGVHVILFFFCLYSLMSRRIRLQWIILSGIVVMFLLTTADIAFSFHLVIRDTRSLVQGTNLTFLAKAFPKYIIYVTNNFVAVMLLIARFYVVWGQKKYLLVLSVVPLMVATAFGYACQIRNPQTFRKFVPVYFLVTLIMNNVLTLLTAGRIWWISRSASDVLGGRGRQYRVTSAIIVESGLLYTISLILTMALSPTTSVTVAAAVTLRMVSIVPVLMVVQIAIGHSPKPVLQDKTADINTTVTNRGVRTSLMLDTVVRTGLSEGSLAELTSQGNSSMMAGHDIELGERSRQPEGRKFDDNDDEKVWD